jgi:hypothetical protein
LLPGLRIIVTLFGWLLAFQHEIPINQLSSSINVSGKAKVPGSTNWRIIIGLVAFTVNDKSLTLARGKVTWKSAVEKRRGKAP